MKVLFVCLGNICRSPTAEGVFKHFVESEGLSGIITSDSAGTSGHHDGGQADSRSMHHAELRGYQLASISRQIKVSDFFDFDLILTMDDSNFDKVIRLAIEIDADTEKVKKFTSYCQIHQINEVPDPYYKGHDGFEEVLDIIEDGCQALLNEIKLNLKK